MATKTEKQKTSEPSKKYSWLKDLGGVGNWMGTYCTEFLKTHKELPKNDPKVLKLKRLSEEGKANLEARLERNEGNKNNVELAYAVGATKAFSEGYYQCPLIYKYLTAKEIDEALR